MLNILLMSIALWSLFAIGYFMGFVMGKGSVKEKELEEMK